MAHGGDSQGGAAEGGVEGRGDVLADAGGYVEGGSNLVEYARGGYKVRDGD